MKLGKKNFVELMTLTVELARRHVFVSRLRLSLSWKIILNTNTRVG
jgi:hypothetical protein